MDTDSRVLSKEDILNGKRKLGMLVSLIRNAVTMFLGDDYTFVTIIRHRTLSQSMMIVGGEDMTRKELSSILDEAAKRNNDGSMLEPRDLDQERKQH